MSGLTGVFMRSGAPVDPQLVEAMVATTPHRAPDGAWKVANGCFAAIRQQTVTTPEDRFETGPVCDPVSRLVILFDGRLDNRDELLQLLGDSQPDHAVCDARVALAAWRKWGTDAPARLLGDFAFVVWDPTERTVSCARDAVGVRPFFYYLSDEVFVFGSEVRQVLAVPSVPRAPDEFMISDLLTFGTRFPERTLYCDLHRLRHAHTLVVNATRSTLNRYWRLDLSRELKLHDDREYADAFREQFDVAVAARLRAAGPIGADLSGGLDSSSIVATARALDPRLSPESMSTFSMIFPGQPAADERSYRSAVLRHTGLAGVEVLPPPLDPLDSRAQVRARHDLPDFPNDAAVAAVKRAMAARGIRVSLCGLGAEDGLGGSFFHYADLLRAGRVLKLARRYGTVATQPDMSWRSAEILRSGVWPSLPVGVRRVIRPLARRAFVDAPPAWLTPAFIRRTALDEAPPLRMIPTGQLARYDTSQRYENVWVQWKRDLFQGICAELGVEERYPFYDRRLIEVMVSLPDEQRLQRGTIKYVLRRAMAGRLPDVVTARPDASKADFTHLFTVALEALGGERYFSDGLHTAANGWVFPREARALYRTMCGLRGRDASAHADAAWRLWTIAAVEMWYRAVFIDGASRSEPWTTATVSRRQSNAQVVARAAAERSTAGQCSLSTGPCPSSPGAPSVTAPTWAR